MNHRSAYFLVKEILNTDAPSASDIPSANVVNVTSVNFSSITDGVLHFKDMVEVTDFSECAHNNKLFSFNNKLLLMRSYIRNTYNEDKAMYLLDNLSSPNPLSALLNCR